MKLPVDILSKNINLKSFGWDKTYLQIILNVKNKYIVPISIENASFVVMSSTGNIFKEFIKASINNVEISALGHKTIIINAEIYNKCASEFISNFFNLKNSIVNCKALSGKVKILSILPINIKNKKIDINIFKIIKSLCE